MGTFGFGNFQNDSGMDFEDDFKEMPTSSTVILASLSIVRTIEAKGDIEYHEACMALAAAEVMAASLGKPSADFPAEFHPLIANLVLNKDIYTRNMARKAVKHMLDKSELPELWAEGDEMKDWQMVQQDLLTRLK